MPPAVMGRVILMTSNFDREGDPMHLLFPPE